MSPDGTWVGTTTTDGTVTTVVNESGSVWGRTATLVEEASIGVESGADEYMFGQISAVAADGRRIIVADGQARAVRTYDYSGRFLQEIGSRGQGPGEFTGLWAVAGDAAGQVYILDVRRVIVYDPEGRAVHTFSVPSAAAGWPIYPTAAGAVWLPIAERDPGTGERSYGVQAYTEEGPQGELLYAPEIAFERVTYTFPRASRHFPGLSPISRGATG